MREVREDALLNGRQCAESIGISARAFYDWHVPHWGTKGRQKLYALKDVLVVYRERIRREMERGLRQSIHAELSEVADPDGLPNDAGKVKLLLDKERARLTREQANAQELKNEIVRHEAAPFSFITFALGKTANEIAGVMDSLPIELMRKLSLQPKDAEKVAGITAQAAEAIANIGGEDWLIVALNDFNRSQEQKST